MADRQVYANKRLERPKRWTWRENLQAWLLILPSLVLIGTFTLWPLGQTLVQSLYQSNMATPVPVFTGLDQYSQVWGDPTFQKVLGNSLVFALVTVPLSMILALVFAQAIHHSLPRVQAVSRILVFYPAVIPMVAAANVWLFIYTPSYGLLDWVLSGFGTGTGTNWLGTPGSVLPALMVMFVWKQAGYLMIFFLAGLQMIRGEFYEAAKLEGKLGFQTFFRITLPLLMPTILFVFVLALTSSFKTVDQLVVMTKGGPDNASSLLLYHIYENAFSFWDTGKACVLTVILLVLLMVTIILNFRSLDGRIHYQE